MVERKTGQATATEMTDSATAGYAQTEGGTVTNERFNSSDDHEESSPDSSEEPAKESEYFAPDPYNEAAESSETEFFALRG